MPRTETYDLREELAALDEEREALAAEVAALDEGEPVPGSVERRRQELERRRAGLAWMLNEDVDGDERDRDPYRYVTVTELRTGAYLKASAQADADVQELDLPSGTDVERLYRVAQAVEEADFVPEDAEFMQTLVAVSDLKPHAFFWLEDVVDELTSPEVEGDDFAQLVVEKRSQMTSTDGDSGSSSPE